MLRKTTIVMLAVAAVAAGLLWPLSHVEDGVAIYVETKRGTVRGALADGRLDIVVFGLRRATDLSPFQRMLLQAGTNVYKRQLAGTYGTPRRSERFYCRWQTSGKNTIESWLLNAGCPVWSLLLAATVYPTLAFVYGPLRRYRRRRRGLCLKCGYNLTGNVTGVCSECGTKVTPP